MSRSIVVFADSQVGLYCVEWLISNYRSDLSCIFTTGKNNIYQLAVENSVDARIFEDEESCLKHLKGKEKICDIGLLIWWPKIISPSIINIVSKGFVNTHPSLLPYSRGKHYNFWTLVEQCPFGVSLHMVDKGIDCGNLVAQKSIEYSWIDNGETLYLKAIEGMKQLFVETYPLIRQISFKTKAQDLTKGSFHYSSELEDASKIILDRPTTARDLLNLLRARTFDGHPACSFRDQGVEYEVTIKVIKKT